MSIRQSLLRFAAWLLCTELPKVIEPVAYNVYTQDLDKSFKAFYVHKHRGPGKLSSPGKYRGFTAYVSPNLESHRLCNVQITYCSNKDAFCKKQGRSFARDAEIKTINKRELPKILGEAYGMLWHRELPNNARTIYYASDYTWMLKYVI